MDVKIEDSWRQHIGEEFDKITYFVHKTVRYFKKLGKQKVQHREIPTVS